MNLLERMASVNPVAARSIRALKASLEVKPQADFSEPATKGQRGRLVGMIDEKIGENGRHALLEIAFGDPSSKSWSLAHYRTLSDWLEKDRALDDLVAIIGTIRMAKDDEVLEQGKERMKQVLDAAGHGDEPTRKENAPMSESSVNVVALLQRSESENLGYEGAGDLMNALGVTEMAEFQGTVADALKLMRENAPNQPEAPPQAATQDDAEETEEYADRDVEPELLDQYLEEVAAMPEAPVLAWTKFQRRPGAPVWSLTLRAGLSPDAMSFALNEIMRATKNFEIWLHRSGGSAVLDSRDQTPGFNQRIGRQQNQSNAPTPQQSRPSNAPPQQQGTSSLPPQAASSNGGAAPPPAASGNGGNGQATVETFKIDSIERDVTSKGDNMYKVQGGPYRKFGVTGYEDVENDVNALMAAAGQEYDIGQLPIKQAWDCSAWGWIAEAEKPAGEKYAKKVIGVKAGS